MDTSQFVIPGFTGSLEDMTAWLRDLASLKAPEDWIRASRPRLYETVGAQGHVVVSRRDLSAPQFRVTSGHVLPVSNPWAPSDDRPIHVGGVLADLLYAGEPRIVDDLVFQPGDPGAVYAEGMHSALALPQYEGEEAPTAMVLLRTDRGGFTCPQAPWALCLSNLFNRGSQALVLREQLDIAYRSLDSEFKAVADIQRSLLPAELPKIPNLDMAAYYETSERAGGDYYDIFPIQGRLWGILIADASGHGPPAAVVMAIMHSLVHAFPATPDPGELLEFLNRCMVERYSLHGSFATAFFAVYNPQDRTLRHAMAGHNPPRLARRGTGKVEDWGEVSGPPLGVTFDAKFPDETLRLGHGDQLLLYTDGITEARGVDRAMYEMGRLDAIVGRGHSTAESIVNEIVADVRRFTGGAALGDDRTLVALRVL